MERRYTVARGGKSAYVGGFRLYPLDVEGAAMLGRAHGAPDGRVAAHSYENDRQEWVPVETVCDLAEAFGWSFVVFPVCYPAAVARRYNHVPGFVAGGEWEGKSWVKMDGSTLVLTDYDWREVA